MKKIILILGVVFIPAFLSAATINIYVHNVNGNLTSSAEVKLYDNNWNIIDSGYTNSSGMVSFALLDYGTYNYEVYYTGDAREFWGSKEDIILQNPTLTSNFTRYWPYRYSYNTPSSPVYTNNPVTFDVTVKNNVSIPRNVKVEIWVDRNQASSWHFHQISNLQSINSNGTKTYTFNFAPTESGTYYWKTHILSYNDGAGNYIVTDSYLWSTAFTVIEPALSITSLTPTTTQIRDWGESVTYTITVKDEAGNPINGASVSGNDNLMLQSFSRSTNSNGIATYTTTVPNGKVNGTYSITFTASKSGYTSSSTLTRYVEVDHTPAPIANFIGNPTSGNSPLNVQFTDQSSGTITSRSWNFGDGGTSNSTNPSHTYNLAGTYTVSLTITGPGGSDTETKNNFITVNPIVANFFGNPTSGNAPLNVQFTDQSSGTITSRILEFWRWWNKQFYKSNSYI